jgi:hypothetical protein
MITIASAQKIAANARIMTVHGERSGRMAQILKIALIGLGIVLALSVFDAIIVGIVYLLRMKAEKSEREEEE